MTDLPQAPHEKPGRPWILILAFSAFGLILIAYTVLWFVAAGRIETELDRLPGEAARHGLTLGWAERTVGGFPFRLGVALDKPKLTPEDGAADWFWRAPEVRAVTLPYAYRHINLTVTGPQEIGYTLEGQPVSLTASTELAQASYVFVDDAPVGRLSVDLTKLTLQGDAAGMAQIPLSGAEKLQIHARPASENPSEMDIAIRGRTVVLGPSFANRVFGAVLDELDLIGRFQPTPRALLEGRVEDWREELIAYAAEGGKLQVRQARLVWGGLNLAADGQLSLDKQQRLAGTLQVSLEEPEKLLDFLKQMGIVRGAGGVFGSMSLSLAKPEKGTNRISLPLAFRGGKVFLGPIPLGTTEPVI